MLLGLGLSACQKEEAIKTSLEINENSTLNLKGKIYEVEYVRRGLSKLLGIPKEQLIYLNELQSFKYDGFILILDPTEYIDDIEILKTDGYEF